MRELPASIEIIDTKLAGRPGITAAYLVRGERPALVETGAFTSTRTVVDAVTAAGIGPDDLAWIVLTHIHLDHCGGTGGVAAAFPNATVVVHPRGPRHLADPARLVSATAAVHGERFPIYGGLDPTPAERIVAAEDGHLVDLGGGRALRMFNTPGHAKHHMAVFDEETGTVFAGDLMGVRMGPGEQYPAMPPADIDCEGWLESLDRVEALGPEIICAAHFGPLEDTAQGLATVREQVSTVAASAAAAWGTGGGVPAVEEAIHRDAPLERWITDPGVLDTWRFLGWYEANPEGVAMWAQARAEAAAGNG